MARKKDKTEAFISAVQINPKGYRWLTTQDFVDSLRERKWHFTLTDANEWIERYQPDFVDKTPEHSDNRLWMLRNMGRVH